MTALARPQRISIVGNAGSGKTTMARSLGRRLEIPHVELDALMHRPGWQPAPPEEFAAAVDGALAAPEWVMCGNYSAVRDAVWRRATTIVWLDYPRRVVMQRVIARTIRRVVTREQLWNGNREPWGNLYRLDPQHSIVAWAWTSHERYRRRYEDAVHDPRWAHLQIVHLRSPADADRWMAAT